MDSITKGQRNLLLFILGCCIIFFPIKYIAMGNFEDRKSINEEKDKQQVYYNDLNTKNQNRQTYIDGAAQYKSDYDAIIAEFPSELYQENIIMYLEGIKNEYDYDFSDVTMGESTLFYTLGSGAVGDVTINSTATASDNTADGTSDATAVAGDAYNCYVASFPVTYKGSYQNVKNVIDYIENSDFRMTVDSINIAFDEETGLYTGDMVFSAYAVNGGDRTTDQVDVNVKTGTTNIFGNPTVKAPTTTTTTESNQ